MGLHMPASYYFIGYVMTFIACCVLRFSYRFLRYWKQNRTHRFAGDKEERIMVVGAGEAGQVIIKELVHSGHFDTKVCCVIDDNPGKRGRYLEGIIIEGGRDQIMRSVKKHDITSSSLFRP